MINVIKAIIEFVMDILETVVFVASLFIVIYLFIMQPNKVSGASMVPSFETNDYIFTSKITTKFRDYQRGDVIVFHSPVQPEIEYIKRVMGLPGDTIMVDDEYVYINGKRMQEDYISPPTTLREGDFLIEESPITVPKGHVFVMGDNRPHSADSREFGPVEINEVVGNVFYRYFPTDKTGWIKNPLPQPLRTSPKKK